MNKQLKLLIAVMAAVWASAGTAVQASVNVQGSEPSRIVVTYELGDLSLQQMSVAGRILTKVALGGAVTQQLAGYPELPSVATNLNIPGEGVVNLRIVDRREHEVVAAPVLPSVGHVTRDIDPATLVRNFGPVYQSGGVYPSAVAELGRPFLLGDRRGVNVRFNPVRWDDGRGVLLITDAITVEVITTGTGGTNSLSSGIPASSHAFRDLQDQSFPNIESIAQAPGADKYSALVAQGRMLIISADALAPALAPFRVWKARRGIASELVLMSETDGTAAGLRQVVRDDYFARPGLTWLVLVGDKDLVPTNTGTYDGSDADSPYAMIVGDDLYPDLFVSRISATELDQVVTQVAKFVGYERDPDTGAAADWYSRGAGVASDEGVPADFERADLLRTDLLNQDYTEVDRIYQGLGATTANITAAVNEGRSLINYLGHGSGLSWDSVRFSTDDVANLTNGHHLPWIVDVSCYNGDFARATCFAEAWLQAGTPEAPAGAVGMIAASSLAPWTPPTVMQAEVVELLTAGTRHTLGALYYSGLMRVLDEYSGIPVATQVIEQNIVFGDASLMVRTAAPANFEVAAPAVIDGLAGPLALSINSTTGGTVAATSGAQLLGVVDFDAGGKVYVPLSAEISTLKSVTVTVTGFNMVPWSTEIAVLNGATPVVDRAVPERAVLRGNYPNPFNPSTRIAFDLPTAQTVALTVYDIRGRAVRQLVSGYLAAGSHRVSWQGTDEQGRTVPSGVYLYRLTTNRGSQTGRMTLSK